MGLLSLSCLFVCQQMNPSVFESKVLSVHICLIMSLFTVFLGFWVSVISKCHFLANLRSSSKSEVDYHAAIVPEAVEIGYVG